MKVNFFTLLALIVLVSCNSNHTNFNGCYQGKSTVKGNDTATTEINLKVVNDTAATIALYHYYNNTLLYTDLAEADSVTTSGDTINIAFKLLADPSSTFEAEQVDRDFVFKFVKSPVEGENKLTMLNPENELLNSAKVELEGIDAKKACFDMKFPQFVVIDEGQFLNFAYGKLKSTSIPKENSATRQYDQNGILTGGGSLVVSQEDGVEGKKIVTRRDRSDSHHVVSTFTYEKDGRLVSYTNSETWKGVYLYDARGRLIGYDGSAAGKDKEPSQWMKKRIYYDNRGAMTRQTFASQNAANEQSYTGCALDAHNNNCGTATYEYYQ